MFAYRYITIARGPGGSISYVVGSNSSYKAYHHYGVGSRPLCKAAASDKV